MAEARVERRLAAILAADVAGYSRSMGADEVGTLAALKAHRREIVDPAIATHKGRIVKTTGDGMLVEFASAVDAVTCAVEFQERMAERAAEGTGPRIQFRVGINIGDIIIDGDDIFGDGVNIAARVENECEPGGVCLSSSAFDQVRGKTRFAFDDLGERALKNIDRPVRLYAARFAITAPIPRASSSAETRAPLPLPNKPSVAVLPFQNMSGDPDQEYFADGMVEEIITALSRNKQLFVIARNSSFTFKGKPVAIKQVARELGVRYVLEGSVRKSANHVRVTGQLIDAATGAHLWADRYDGALEDVFELQDQVAASVAGAIGPSVTTAEIERAKRKSTDSLDAYDCFLRGQAAHWQATKDGTDQGIALYEQAIALDPEFAPAHAALAAAINQRRSSGWSTDPAADVARSIACADSALRLGTQDASVMARIALVLCNDAGEVERADSLLAEAIRLNPNEMYAWLWRGWSKLFLGDHESGKEHFQRAIRLSPMDPRIFHAHAGLACAYFLLGAYQEGLKYASEALRDRPDYPTGLRLAIACSALAGNREAAQEYWRRLALLAPSERVSDLRKRAPYRREQDFNKLEEAYRLTGMPE